MAAKRIGNRPLRQPVAAPPGQPPLPPETDQNGQYVPGRRPPLMSMLITGNGGERFGYEMYLSDTYTAEGECCAFHVRRELTATGQMGPVIRTALIHLGDWKLMLFSKNFSPTLIELLGDVIDPQTIRDAAVLIEPSRPPQRPPEEPKAAKRRGERLRRDILPFVEEFLRQGVPR